MGQGYQVILDDLGAMADGFTQESTQFTALEPRMAPPAVGSGDPTLDAGIEAVVALFQAANAQISESMKTHGAKLLACHDTYRSTDADIVVLYNRMAELLE